MAVDKGTDIRHIAPLDSLTVLLTQKIFGVLTVLHVICLFCLSKLMKLSAYHISTVGSDGSDKPA